MVCPPHIWEAELAAALSQLAADIKALGVVEVNRYRREVGIRDELVARNLYHCTGAANNALKHSSAANVSDRTFEAGRLLCSKCRMTALWRSCGQGVGHNARKAVVSQYPAPMQRDWRGTIDPPSPAGSTIIEDSMAESRR